jgi:glycerol-3-phosphate dehydrogenase (NAD(P)+)
VGLTGSRLTMRTISALHAALVTTLVLVTCWSRYSRNRRAGALMARGATPQDAVRKLKTVEGLTTAPILRDLSESLGIELPITNGIAEALEGRPIGHVIADFMRRPPTGE